VLSGFSSAIADRAWRVSASHKDYRLPPNEQTALAYVTRRAAPHTKERSRWRTLRKRYYAFEPGRTFRSRSDIQINRAPGKCLGIICHRRGRKNNPGKGGGARVAGNLRVFAELREILALLDVYGRNKNYGRTGSAAKLRVAVPFYKSTRKPRSSDREQPPRRVEEN